MNLPKLFPEIILGTAQYGMRYGVTGDSRIASDSELEKILDLARAHGMSAIDTSQQYGNAEERLGNFDLSFFKIVSKMNMPTSETDLQNFDVESKLIESLDKLNVRILDTLLVHNAHAIDEVRLHLILKKLHPLKDKGLIKNLGISIYAPDILQSTRVLEEIDVVQAPYNAFDQRISESNLLRRCSTAGVTISVRSIFLQGVLLNYNFGMPSFFDKWHRQFHLWDEWLKKNEMSALEGSLNQASEALNRGINSFVVGVRSANELQEILSAYSTTNGKLCFDGASKDLELITPYMWPSS